MKIVKTDHGMVVVELTRRNLETLLEKFDDPNSVKSLLSPCRSAMVVAVENEEHYSDREPGRIYTNGEWK
jgi:hypothetical protein